MRGNPSPDADTKTQADRQSIQMFAPKHPHFCAVHCRNLSQRRRTIPAKCGRMAGSAEMTLKLAISLR
jgi:hypothetical protein